MTNNKPKFSRECSTHSEEPIIRASLDLKSSKLLYCHECLGGMNKSSQSNLIKFGHIGDKLYEQLTERYEYFNKSNVDIDFTKFSINKQDFETKVEDLILQQREKVEEEFNKVQAEVLEVLKSAKTQTLETLDKVKTNTMEAYSSYMEKVNNLADLSTSKDKGVTKEEIENEIADDKEDVAAIENRIRTRLETIKRFDEIKEGVISTALETQKTKLENYIGALKLAPNKDAEYYKSTLYELTTFFQTIVFENKDRKDDNLSPSLLSGQSEWLSDLAQTVQVSQSALRKMKDPVNNYLTYLTNYCQSDSTSTKPNSSPARNTVASRNVRANHQYDEGFDVESDDEEIEIESIQSEVSGSRSHSNALGRARASARSASRSDSSSSGTPPRHRLSIMAQSENSEESDS